MDEVKLRVIDMVYVVTVVCNNSANPSVSKTTVMHHSEDSISVNTFDLKGKVYGSDTEQSITGEMCLVSISILPKTSDGFSAIKR